MRFLWFGVLSGCTASVATLENPATVDNATPPATVWEPSPVVDLHSWGFIACSLDGLGRADCRDIMPWGRPPPADWTPEVETPAGPLIDIVAIGPCGLDADGAVTCVEDRSEWLHLEAITTAPAELVRFDLDHLDDGQTWAAGLDAQGDLHLWGDLFTGAPTYVEGTYTDLVAQNSTVCAWGPDRIDCWSEREAVRSNTPTGSFVDIAIHPTDICGLRGDGEVLCWGEAPAELWQLPPDVPALEAIDGGYGLSGHLLYDLTDGYSFGWGEVPLSGLAVSASGICTAIEGQRGPQCQADPRLPPVP